MVLSILEKILPQEKKDSFLFLVLEITDDLFKAAACQIQNEKIGVLAISSQEYNGSWENALEAADTAISNVEENLPGKTLEKVILGLPLDYVSDGKIIPEKLSQIRILCEKLSLTPLGFVEIPLSIANFLKTETGGPESFLLLRLAKKLDVTLIRVGRISNHLTLPRSENLAQDLEAALKSFADVEVLPSKILLYNNGSLEKEKQELMSYPWTSRVSFLHFPKIESAQADLDIKSLAFAGAKEMGTIEKVEQAEQKVGEMDPEPEIIEGENFGFVKEEAIEKPEKNVLVSQEIKPKLPKLPKLEIKLPKLSFPKLSFGGAHRKIIAAAVGVIFLSLALSFFYFWPQAKVSLILKQKIITQPLEVTIDPAVSSVSLEKKILPGINFQKEEKSTQKTATTGKKTVGEKAKGTVTVFNKTTAGKTFKKDTVLNGPNNLKFSLDKEVSIASASDTGSTLVYGKADVSVTAVNLGTEGNLGAGQTFQFSDYAADSYTAKNSSAFGGGTSRQISVVSSSDKEKLLFNLTALLTKQAKGGLLSKLGLEEKLIEETLAGTVIEKDFDKEIEEEGTELSLTLKMNFKAVGYKNSDLVSFLEKTVEKSIPPNYEPDKGSIKMDSVELQKKKDGNYNLSAKSSLILRPNVDKKVISQNILGKNLKEVDNYLRQTANIAGYQIQFGRQLPFFKSLPKLSSNLTIETSLSK